MGCVPLNRCCQQTSRSDDGDELAAHVGDGKKIALTCAPIVQGKGKAKINREKDFGSTDKPIGMEFLEDGREHG